MPNLPKRVTGVIRGNTVELDEPTGFPDGTVVSVELSPLREKRLPPGEGIRLSAGAWAGDDEEGLTSIWIGVGSNARSRDRKLNPKLPAFLKRD